MNNIRTFFSRISNTVTCHRALIIFAALTFSSFTFSLHNSSEAVHWSHVRPVHCATQKAAALLIPFKAVFSENVKCINNYFDWGYAMAKNDGDILVIVYFRGFSEANKINSDDLKWSVKDEKYGNINSICLGISGADAPFQIIGVVPAGNWISLQGSTDPLLALVFVTQQKNKELVLTNPSGEIYKLSISNDWSPKKENFILSTRYSAMEFNGPTPSDLWITKNDLTIENANEWIDKAKSKIKNRDYEGTIGDCDKAIAADPKYTKAYYFRGAAKYNLARYKEALVDLDQAIYLDPKYGFAYYERADTKFVLGEYSEALADFDMTIALDPKLVAVYDSRGFSKYCLGRFEDAIKDFDQVIALDPRFASAFNNRGLAEASLGRDADAIADYDKAISLYPEYSTAYYNRGNAKDMIGQYESAKVDYNRAISIDDHLISLEPKFALAYSNRGLAKISLGLYTEAVADFDHAIEISQIDPVAYNGRGYAYYKLGGDKANYQKAIEDYNNAKKLFGWRYKPDFKYIDEIAMPKQITGSQNISKKTYLETPKNEPSGSGTSGAYKSWSKFKIGTSIEYTLKFSNDAEGTTQLPLYYALSELNGDELVIDINLPAGSKLKYPAKIKLGQDPQAGLLRPCALAFKKVLGSENIVISGRNLLCTYGEVENNNGSKEKGKQWVCDSVPGRLVKLQVSTISEGKTTVWEMTLKRIFIKTD